jgi:hypothetical protein
MKVELLYFDDCPHWQIADARLRTVVERLGLSVEHRLVTTPEEADAAGFRGSPTILLDCVDPFARGDEPFGLACRVYQTPEGPAGSATVEQIKAALTRG